MSPPDDLGAGLGTGNGEYHPQQPPDETLEWPEWLYAVWDRLDKTNHHKLRGPWDEPDRNYRLSTLLCMRLLRHHGLPLSQVIQAARCFPEGFGKLSGHASLIRDLWREHDEEEAKAEAERKAQEEAAARAPVNPATLEGLAVPPRQWLVPGWIPMSRASAIYGPGGEGKTTLAQMLATACALRDAKWLGMPVRQCRSVLHFCEDDLEEMWRRQEDINRFYGCSFADLGAMLWLPRLGFDNTLMAFNGHGPVLTDLYTELVDHARAHRAELIIPDTLADVFGGSEIDRGQARSFVQTALGGMARQLGAAVVALAHPSLSGTNSGQGSSGSTGWIGTFRSHLYLSSPKADEGDPLDPNARILTRVKANAAKRGETIEMHWRDGVFVTDYVPSGVVGSIEKSNCEDVFLRLLIRLVAEGRYVSSNSRSGNYCARVFAKCPDRDRFKEKDFQSAMERMFASKAIRMGTYRDAQRHLQQCIMPATADSPAQ